MAQRPVPDIENPPLRQRDPAVSSHETQNGTLPPDEAPAEIIYVGRRAAYTKRAGCGCAVIGWSLLMLLPLALFILAIQGEIGLWRGDRIPEPEAHPLLQVRLLSEIRNQGLVITASSIASQSRQQGEERACVITHVRYLMWEGEGQDASYCDCYVRPAESASNAAWRYSGTTQNSCEVLP